MKLSKKEKKIIKSHLPELKNLILNGENENYKNCFVSIFDHWLTREETSLIFQKTDTNELKKRQRFFQNFAEQLYHKTSIYYWKLKNKDRIHIKKFRDFNHFKDKCKFTTITEDHGEVYGFIIPEYSAVYKQYWDWTNQLWHLEESKITPILKLIKENRLYKLDPN